MRVRGSATKGCRERRGHARRRGVPGMPRRRWPPGGLPLHPHLLWRDPRGGWSGSSKPRCCDQSSRASTPTFRGRTVRQQLRLGLPTSRSKTRRRSEIAANEARSTSSRVKARSPARSPADEGRCSSGAAAPRTPAARVCEVQLAGDGGTNAADRSESGGRRASRPPAVPLGWRIRRHLAQKLNQVGCRSYGSRSAVPRTESLSSDTGTRHLSAFSFPTRTAPLTTAPHLDRPRDAPSIRVSLQQEPLTLSSHETLPRRTATAHPVVDLACLELPRGAQPCGPAWLSAIQVYTVSW